MPYKIVYSANGSSDIETMCQCLQKKVDILMEEGWSCVGGIASGPIIHGYYRLYQAMIKP